MFRHQGKSRTYTHNLKLASLLSFVAGAVNAIGFLTVQVLTTNVTGHFAFLVEEVFYLNFDRAFTFFCYVIFFFLGSFFSGFISEFIHRKGSERYIYIIPASVEVIILYTLAIWGPEWKLPHPAFIAFSLLFAMGLQNALVTMISGSIVRTTHLTGLFTDLGIELSQLFFYRSKIHKIKLKSSIRLRLSIIFFFFLGGIAGGFGYEFLKIKALFIIGTVLLAGLIYDWVKFRVLKLTEKLKFVAVKFPGNH